MIKMQTVIEARFAILEVSFKAQGAEIGRLTKEISQLKNQVDEKYVDDCAMRIFQGMLSSGSFDITYEDAIKKSYDLAESMLKEKLKRKKND